MRIWQGSNLGLMTWTGISRVWEKLFWWGIGKIRIVIISVYRRNKQSIIGIGPLSRSDPGPICGGRVELVLHNRSSGGGVGILIIEAGLGIILFELVIWRSENLRSWILLTRCRLIRVEWWRVVISVRIWTKVVFSIAGVAWLLVIGALFEGGLDEGTFKLPSILGKIDPVGSILIVLF